MAAVNSGVNVLRYSALFGGVAYGLYHQAAINTLSRKHQIDAQYNEQINLISKAKAEWVKKTNPQINSGGGVISDPEDPKFDLEAYLTMKSAEEAK